MPQMCSRLVDPVPEAALCRTSAPKQKAPCYIGTPAPGMAELTFPSPVYGRCKSVASLRWAPAVAAVCSSRVRAERSACRCG